MHLDAIGVERHAHEIDAANAEDDGQVADLAALRVRDAIVDAQGAPNGPHLDDCPPAAAADDQIHLTPTYCHVAALYHCSEPAEYQRGDLLTRPSEARPVIHERDISRGCDGSTTDTW